MLALSAWPAGADFEQIDTLLKELDAVNATAAVTFTLDDIINIAIDKNADLKIEEAILNTVEGDVIDKSRFLSHVDFIAETTHGQGVMQRPFFRRQSVGCVPDRGSRVQFIPAFERDRFLGQFVHRHFQPGIAVRDPPDVSSLLSQIPSQYQSLAQQFLGGGRVVGDGSTSVAPRTAQQTIPGTNIDLAQLQDLINQFQQVSQLFNTTTTSTSKVLDSQVF